MKLLHRFAYYSLGLVMGIVILMFFLSGKKTTCDYSPNARTLKNIRIKDRVFSDEAFRFFQFNNLDTSYVSSILDNGKVNFGKSNTENEPCNIYFVSGDVDTKKIELQIENCETTATIQRVSFSE